MCGWSSEVCEGEKRPVLWVSAFACESHRESPWWSMPMMEKYVIERQSNPKKFGPDSIEFSNWKHVKIDAQYSVRVTRLFIEWILYGFQYFWRSSSITLHGLASFGCSIQLPLHPSLLHYSACSSHVLCLFRRSLIKFENNIFKTSVNADTALPAVNWRSDSLLASTVSRVGRHQVFIGNFPL